MATARVPARVSELSDDDAGPMELPGAPVAAPAMPTASGRVLDLPMAPKADGKPRPVAKAKTGTENKPKAKPKPKSTPTGKAKAKCLPMAKGKAKAKADTEAPAKATATAKAVSTESAMGSTESAKDSKVKAKDSKKTAKDGTTGQAAKRKKDMPKDMPGDAVDSTNTEVLNVDGKYILMKYGKHGKEGTYAVRERGGPQFMEINIPNATLVQNQEVAQALCNELNKGVAHSTVQQLAVVLKEAMLEKTMAHAT